MYFFFKWYYFYKLYFWLSDLDMTHVTHKAATSRHTTTSLVMKYLLIGVIKLMK